MDPILLDESGYDFLPNLPSKKRRRKRSHVCHLGNKQGKPSTGRRPPGNGATSSIDTAKFGASARETSPVLSYVKPGIPASHAQTNQWMLAAAAIAGPDNMEISSAVETPGSPIMMEIKCEEEHIDISAMNSDMTDFISQEKAPSPEPFSEVKPVLPALHDQTNEPTPGLDSMETSTAVQISDLPDMVKIKSEDIHVSMAKTDTTECIPKLEEPNTFSSSDREVPPSCKDQRNQQMPAALLDMESTTAAETSDSPREAAEHVAVGGSRQSQAQQFVVSPNTLVQPKPRRGGSSQSQAQQFVVSPNTLVQPKPHVVLVRRNTCEYSSSEDSRAIPVSIPGTSSSNTILPQAARLVGGKNSLRKVVLGVPVRKQNSPAPRETALVDPGRPEGTEEASDRSETTPKYYTVLDPRHPDKYIKIRSFRDFKVKKGIDVKVTKKPDGSAGMATKSLVVKSPVRTGAAANNLGRHMAAATKSCKPVRLRVLPSPVSLSLTKNLTRPEAAAEGVNTYLGAKSRNNSSTAMQSRNASSSAAVAQITSKPEAPPPNQNGSAVATSTLDRSTEVSQSPGSSLAAVQSSSAAVKKRPAAAQKSRSAAVSQKRKRTKTTAHKRKRVKSAACPERESCSPAEDRAPTQQDMESVRRRLDALEGKLDQIMKLVMAKAPAPGSVLFTVDVARLHHGRGISSLQTATGNHLVSLPKRGMLFCDVCKPGGEVAQFLSGSGVFLYDFALGTEFPDEGNLPAAFATLKQRVRRHFSCDGHKKALQRLVMSRAAAEMLPVAQRAES